MQTTSSQNHLQKRVGRDKSCIKRHPKTCQYFAKYNFCRNRDQYAYNHHKGKHGGQIDALETEVKVLRAEVEKILKSDAKIISKLNTFEENDIDIKEKLKNLRKEVNDMNEVKSKSTEQNRNTDSHEKNDNSLQCNICDFVAALKRNRRYRF